MPKQKPKPTDLVSEIGNFFADPLGYVLFNYPWGQAGTSLVNETGPDAWQADLLRQVGAGVLKVGEAIQLAVASGHGVGKSALVAWLIQWFASTRAYCQGVVTANTETQLTTKTWRELAKWHKLSLNRDWFEWTATKFYHKQHASTWFISAIPWSENNSEAFAGTHERDVLMIFDEASAIPDIIWETAEGAMTTPGAMWFVFGNPTKNTGRFRQCFGRFKHRWLTRQVDSRTAKKADKKQLQKWVEDYGEDSDFIRVRVRGVFPRSGARQFIDSESLELCREYKADGFDRFPVVLGVDVARGGDCESVICCRQGRKVRELKGYRDVSDTMQLAAYIGEALVSTKAQSAFIEGTGVGGPVVDRLRQLGHGERVIEVNTGKRFKETEDWGNERARMWCAMRDYLKAGAELPDDPDLFDQLSNINYHFNDKNQILMEKKEDMQARGLASPDRADALALTFCFGNVVVLDKHVRPLEMPLLGCA